MLRTMGLGLLSLTVLVAWTSSSPAQIFSLRTPVVSVRVGPPVVPVQVVQVVQDPLPPPTRIVPPPRVMPPADIVPVPTPQVVVLRPMTHYEFAACFKPTPGCHEALLIHPGSGCAHLVRFTLPPGCPRVCVSRRELTFDYGCQEVEIRFKLFGKVAVHY